MQLPSSCGHCARAQEGCDCTHICSCACPALPAAVLLSHEPTLSTDQCCGHAIQGSDHRCCTPPAAAAACRQPRAATPASPASACPAACTAARPCSSPGECVRLLSGASGAAADPQHARARTGRTGAGRRHCELSSGAGGALDALSAHRHEDAARCDGEDDGFLISYCHDTSADQSSLRIWDARTMDSTPLVSRLPTECGAGGVIRLLTLAGERAAAGASLIAAASSVGACLPVFACPGLPVGACQVHRAPCSLTAAGPLLAAAGGGGTASTGALRLPRPVGHRG